MNYLNFLLVASILLGANGTPKLINEEVDGYLKKLGLSIQSSGSDVVKIPRVNDEWKYEGRFLSLSGNVVCWDGWIKPLSTVQRKGDAIMVKMRNETFIRLELGLERIEFGFGKCAVTHFLTFAGPVAGSVDQNAIKWVVSLRKGSTGCVAKTEEISILRLDGINLNSSSFLDKAENKIVEYLSGFFRKTIVDCLERKLKEISSYAIQNFDFCSFAT